jgi:acetyl-CoA acetyltransferase family protein
MASGDVCATLPKTTASTSAGETPEATSAARAALVASGVSPADVDAVVFGNVAQTSPDAIYLARHVGLRCELPQAVPALTVNRLCGSGFEAIVQGAQLLMLGDAKTVLVGGSESMSQAPFAIRDARFGVPLGKTPQMEDTLWSSLTDSFTGMPMAMTAEKLAETHKITQEQVDTFAVRSQRLTKQAQDNGAFDDEITPVEVKKGKEVVAFAKDEHNRPETTVDGLKKLPKVFKKDGVIHAGAASGVCDGAAALVMTTASHAKAKGWKPIGRLVGWGVAGCDPTVMGIGPVPAIRALLDRAGLALDAIGLVEINEAFGAQVMACARELGLDEARLNVNGGAIAIGHPLAATGLRLSLTVAREMRRRGLRYGVASACIGGGQGIALLLENPDA